LWKLLYFAKELTLVGYGKQVTYYALRWLFCCNTKTKVLVFENMLIVCRDKKKGYLYHRRRKSLHCKFVYLRLKGKFQSISIKKKKDIVKQIGLYKICILVPCPSLILLQASLVFSEAFVILPESAIWFSFMPPQIHFLGFRFKKKNLKT
jgi:hypothetical protein